MLHQAFGDSLMPEKAAQFLCLFPAILRYKISISQLPLRFAVIGLIYGIIALIVTREGHLR